MSKVRVDGFGCDGCYNCRKLEHTYTYPYYCKAYVVEGKMEPLSGSLMVELLYRVIDHDMNNRPDWCPLEDLDD